MAIVFVEIKPADSPIQLNTEWVVIANTGDLPFQTRGVAMTVGRRGSAKKYVLGVVDPGFILKPGERIRMCTGNPATEAHGTPPAETDDLKNYFLFRRQVYVTQPATVLTLALRGMPISKAEFDPSSPSGVRMSW